MKNYGIDMDGIFFGQVVNTLPSYDSSFAGRMLYALDTKKYYYGSSNSNDWSSLEGVDLDTFYAHVDSTAVHGATHLAIPGRIMTRDENGRAKVASPSSSDDIAIKQTVDDEATTRSSVDSSLQSQITAEASNRSTADSTHAALTGTSPHSMTTTNTASRGVVRDGSGDIFARLLRSEYTSTSGSCNYFMGQVSKGSGVDNYLRPMTKDQARNLLMYTSSLAYSLPNASAGGAAPSYTGTGYVKTTGGIIIQWGYAQVTTYLGLTYITLPITYTSYQLATLACKVNSTADMARETAAYIPSSTAWNHKSQVGLYNTHSSITDYMWYLSVGY